MSYADLSQDAAILLAIEFVAQDASMPLELSNLLGEALMHDIQNPVGEPYEQNTESGAGK